MKKITFGKLLIPVALVLGLGLVTGCSSSPKEPEADSMADAAKAVDAAKAAVAEANSLHWIWRDTEEFLAEAETELAAGAGHQEKAIELANKARNQANLAVNQYYLEKAKFLYQDASGSAGLTTKQRNTLSEAQKAIRSAEGRKAYDLLAAL
jgi:hypothetical protein